MGVVRCTCSIQTQSVSAVHIFAGVSVPKVKSQVGIFLGNRGECILGCFFGREGRYGKSYNEEQNGGQKRHQKFEMLFHNRTPDINYFCRL